MYNLHNNNTMVWQISYLGFEEFEVSMLMLRSKIVAFLSHGGSPLWLDGWFVMEL